ncbi:MAG TPA: bacterioferritin [Anaerolineaceae bacterium]|nr:bacterioferritin [Anaerolineaceae bacterium]
MKGNEKVIETLNDLLSDELTAINQYIVHAEMAEDWGYPVLHESAENRAITEMKHAEKHIARILFLEGRPIVSKLKSIHIGEDVPKMYENDRMLEQEAIEKYNAAIKLCVEVGDNGTKEMLDAILQDEEDHIDYIEGELEKITQMGLAIYLTTLTK